MPKSVRILSWNKNNDFFASGRQRDAPPVYNISTFRNKSQEPEIQIPLPAFASNIFVLARMLQMNKNPTAEELHKLIMRKKVTYEQIRRVD